MANLLCTRHYIRILTSVNLESKCLHVKFIFSCDNVCRLIPDASQLVRSCKYVNSPSYFADLHITLPLSKQKRIMDVEPSKPNNLTSNFTSADASKCQEDELKGNMQKVQIHENVY